jgi:beta-glucanase (GH16 family)
VGILGCRLVGSIPGWAQETLVPFELAIGFASDHLELHAHGYPWNDTVTSGVMVSRRSWRSICVEARYQIPAIPGAWPAFWLLGEGTTCVFGCPVGPLSELSEIDVEQPISVTPRADGRLGVTTVELNNHPEGTITPIASEFHPDLGSTVPMALVTTTDYSATAHRYTTCYDDRQATITRYVDGALIYTAEGWRWVGPPPHVIVSLSVGGWPGVVTDPSAFNATLALYSLDYYAPRDSARHTDRER